MDRRPAVVVCEKEVWTFFTVRGFWQFACLLCYAEKSEIFIVKFSNLSKYLESIGFQMVHTFWSRKNLLKIFMFGQKKRIFDRNSRSEPRSVGQFSRMDRFFFWVVGQIFPTLIQLNPRCIRTACQSSGRACVRLWLYTLLIPYFAANLFRFVHFGVLCVSPLSNCSHRIEWSI